MDNYSVLWMILSDETSLSLSALLILKIGCTRLCTEKVIRKDSHEMVALQENRNRNMYSGVLLEVTDLSQASQQHQRTVLAQKEGQAICG